MRRTRVLLAKAGLDGHDRGIKLVARYLMEAGMEVIFLGPRATPAEVVSAALDEDVEVLGLSFLAGDHMVLAPRILAGLKEKGLEEVMVLLGGIVPRDDAVRLEAMGVRRVFLPGTPPGEIVKFIQQGAAT
jgi:methylmalonyl-CoA mutase, C-terminal domain